MKKVLSILLIIVASAWCVRGQESYPVVDVKVSTDKVRIGDKQFLTHVVIEKQTLYSIGKAYGVTVDAIIAANPKLQLNTKSIKAGDVLLIPIYDEVKVESNRKPAIIGGADGPTAIFVKDESNGGPAHVSKDSIVDSVLTKQYSIDAHADSLTHASEEKLVEVNGKSASLSLLLPFNGDTTANKSYLNFYVGALLATKYFADKGMNIEINAIDTEKEEELALNRRAICESDIIIGPVSGYDISRILELIPDNKYIVSPLDTRTESLTYENNVILAATPAQRQIEDVVDWISEDMYGRSDSLIVVRESRYKSTPTESATLHYLSKIPQDRLINVEYSLANGLEMNEWFGAHTHLKDTLTRVIAASEHDIFVDDVIRNVYLQNNLKKNTIIYGPAKTKSPEMDQMCDARLHSCVTYHIDYTRADVKRFVKDFRALYGSEPDSFAFHGFDTAYYLRSACARYGEEWFEHLSEFHYSGLQIFFKFEKPFNWNGAVNSGLRRLVYSPGYKLSIFDR